MWSACSPKGLLSLRSIPVLIADLVGAGSSLFFQALSDAVLHQYLLLRFASKIVVNFS
jgi:hypothetical protein